MTILELIQKYLPKASTEMQVDFYTDILNTIAHATKGTVTIDKNLIRETLLGSRTEPTVKRL